MNLLSPSQVAVLEHLESRDLGVLEVNANTAAALMFRDCIVYHTARSNYTVYRITLTGKTMLKAQHRITKTALTFKLARTNILNTKRIAKRRSKAIKKHTKKRVKQRLRAVA